MHALRARSLNEPYERDLIACLAMTAFNSERIRVARAARSRVRSDLKVSKDMFLTPRAGSSAANQSFVKTTASSASGEDFSRVFR